MPIHYQIIVAEPLASHWSDWFNGLTITPNGDGATTLTGPIPDQSALYGILSRARDLNLTLLALHRVEPITNSFGNLISDHLGEQP